MAGGARDVAVGARRRQTYRKGAGAKEDLDEEIAAVTAALAQVDTSNSIR